MNLSEIHVGDRVAAFHPQMLGVVKEGVVVKVGRTWVHVNFGALLGGVVRVAGRDIVSVDSAFRRETEATRSMVADMERDGLL